MPKTLRIAPAAAIVLLAAMVLLATLAARYGPHVLAMHFHGRHTAHLAMHYFGRTFYHG
jgi:hypothetical protein